MRAISAAEGSSSSPAGPSEAVDMSAAEAGPLWAGGPVGTLPRRRRKRRRFPWTGLILGAAVVITTIAGGRYLYLQKIRPGPGARALELLPATTLMAASMERVDQLEADLSGSAEENDYTAALSRLRKGAEDWLADGLGIAGDSASSLLSGTVAVGVGFVPVEGGTPARVVLLALRGPDVATAALGKAPTAGEAAGRTLYGQQMFAVQFGDVLVMCARRECLAQMVQSFLNRGEKSLGGVAEFVEARKNNCRKGRAWFYAAGRSLRELDTTGAVGPFPMSKVRVAANFAPEVDHVAGFVELAGSRLVLRGSGRIRAGEKLRLRPRAVTTAQFAPEDANVFLCVSLTNIISSYAQLLEAADARYKTAEGNTLSDLIRNFERSKDPGPEVGGEIVPIVNDEIAAVWTTPGLTLDGLIIPVLDRNLAGSVTLRVLKKLFEVEPKEITRDKIAAHELPGEHPIAYAFLNNILLLSRSSARLFEVMKAVSSQKSLANNPVFQQAMKDLPEKSSLLLVVQENREAQERRYGLRPAMVAISVSTTASDLSVVGSVPNLIDLVLALKPAWKEREAAEAAAGRGTAAQTSPPGAAAPGRESPEDRALPHHMQGPTRKPPRRPGSKPGSKPGAKAVEDAL